MVARPGVVASRNGESAYPKKDHAVQRAYETVRAMAIAYRFAPGERLNEVELARELNVSRTPLREAMNRLSSEGLLSPVPGRGFYARRLDTKEVFDLYEARLAIEMSVVELACDRVTKEALAELDAFLDQSLRENETAPIERLVQLDEGFHERLSALSGNSELSRMLRNINARIHFFRWIDMRGRRGDTQREHVAIATAIRNGDKPAARKIVAAHITRRMDQIIEVIREGYARIHMGEGPQIAGSDWPSTRQEDR